MSEATMALEEQIKAEKELVELHDCVHRLQSNRDFRRLINDEFLLKEPARLAMMAGDPIMDPQQRADAAEMSRAAGHLKRFLSATHTRGKHAASNIKDIEAQLDEVRAEEAND